MELVFIHGSGGAAESFAYQLATFSNARALNLPGHPHGVPITSVAAYAQWLNQALRTSKKPLVLLGHSLGGGIVLQYALDYPSELAGIVLLGSGARLRVHPKYLEPLERALSDPSEYNAQSGGYERVNSELAAVMSRRRIENGPRAMLNDMRACDAFDIMQRIDEIKLPVLAVVGRHDVMTPVKYSEFLAQKLPRCKLHIIEDAGHMAYAEKPFEVNEVISDFLRQLG